MANPIISTKRMAISKANAQMVGIVAAASVVTVFCLVASQTVLSQNSYQARVTKQKETANRQLKSDIVAFNQLSASYKSFNGSATNSIGGSKNGSGDNDGDNAKIIYHALPDKYDFPSLASSLEKLLADRSFHVAGLNGVDDQIAQQTNLTSATPAAVPMPFTLSVDSLSYTDVPRLLTSLQASIRPIQVDTLSLSGGSPNIKASIVAHTFYQPGMSFTVTKKVQK